MSDAPRSSRRSAQRSRNSRPSRRIRSGVVASVNPDLELFRSHLACFCLVVRWRKVSSWQLNRSPELNLVDIVVDRFGLPKLLEEARISEIGHLVTNRTYGTSFRRLVKIFLSGIRRRVLRRKTPVNETKKRQRRWGGGQSSKTSDLNVITIPAATGREVLKQHLDLYHPSKLVRFIDSFCSPFVSRSDLSKMKAGGKVGLVMNLIELFFSGTLPHQRRQEESQILRNVDELLENLQFHLCGIEIPKEIMVEILSFCVFDYELISSLGCVGMSYYALILSNWGGEVYVQKQTVHAIPCLVFRVASSVCISENPHLHSHRRAHELSIDEYKYLLNAVSREKMTSLSFDVGLRRISFVMQRLMECLRRHRPFPSLQELSFRRQSFVDGDASSQYRLQALAPNLTAVNWPNCLAWCLGLQLTSLSILDSLVVEASAEKIRGLFKSLRKLQIGVSLSSPSPSATKLVSLLPSEGLEHLEIFRLRQISGPQWTQALSFPCFSELRSLILHPGGEGISSQASFLPTCEVGYTFHALTTFKVVGYLPLMSQIQIVESCESLVDVTISTPASTFVCPDCEAGRISHLVSRACDFVNLGIASSCIGHRLVISERGMKIVYDFPQLRTNLVVVPTSFQWFEEHVLLPVHASGTLRVLKIVISNYFVKSIGDQLIISRRAEIGKAMRGISERLQQKSGPSEREGTSLIVTWEFSEVQSSVGSEEESEESETVQI